MNIAYVVPYAPFPLNSGGRLRIHSLWRALSTLGKVRLVVMGDHPSLATRRMLAAEKAVFYPHRREQLRHKLWRYLRAGLSGDSIEAASYLSMRRIRRLLHYLAMEQVEVVIMGDISLSALLPHLKTLGTKLVVDTHNVESLAHLRMTRTASNILEKARHLWLCHNFDHVERRYLPLADMIWTVSHEDARYYSETLSLPRVLVLPNVLDLSRYPTHQQGEAGAIVFTGWFKYLPNEDAALRLISLSRRLRLEEVPHRLYLVGRDPTNKMRKAVEGEKQVVITGEVPDIQPYLGRASVFAAPIAAGSGTKFKVLEAMAMAKPVLTTTIGAEGLSLENGVHALIADDMEIFYVKLKQLLTDVTLCASLGWAAQQLVRERFSMDALEKKIVEAMPKPQGSSGQSIEQARW